MTRGMVKSGLIRESKWVIRSQAPHVIIVFITKVIIVVCSSSTRCWLAFFVRLVDDRNHVYVNDKISLRYSQASPEKVQDNIVLTKVMFSKSRF